MTIASHPSPSRLPAPDARDALAARAAELDRREAALRQGEQERDSHSAAFAIASSVQAELDVRLQDVELRERELAQARVAFESQRERLAAVQAEYESRREALATRTRELEDERTRLRGEQARLVSLALQLERRLEEVAEPRGTRHPRPGMAWSERDWWSKQLGSPLEAA